GLIALRLGGLQAAAVDFTRGMEANPDRPDFRYQRAQTWLRLGRFQDALTDLDTEIRSHPQDAAYYELRSETHQNLGDHEQALADLRRAGELPLGDLGRVNRLA